MVYMGMIWGDPYFRKHPYLVWDIWTAYPESV